VQDSENQLRTFSSAREFRTWLRAHHRSATELLVRCYKVAAEDHGLTYREALDEALCFGWIDGVRRAVDGQSFSTRFTPRKAKSYWSAINVKRAKQLAQRTSIFWVMEANRDAVKLLLRAVARLA
jgi:uncharacterized protein YdeI (YjbR/CyaY-like superfamily)